MLFDFCEKGVFHHSTFFQDNSFFTSIFYILKLKHSTRQAEQLKPVEVFNRKAVLCLGFCK